MHPTILTFIALLCTIHACRDVGTRIILIPDQNDIANTIEVLINKEKLPENFPKFDFESFETRAKNDGLPARFGPEKCRYLTAKFLQACQQHCQEQKEAEKRSFSMTYAYFKIQVLNYACQARCLDHYEKLQQICLSVK